MTNVSDKNFRSSEPKLQPLPLAPTPMTKDNLKHLLLEVCIIKPVQNRVHNTAECGHQVRGQKEGRNQLLLQLAVVEVEQQVEEEERQPTKSETQADHFEELAAVVEALVVAHKQAALHATAVVDEFDLVVAEGVAIWRGGCRDGGVDERGCRVRAWVVTLSL